MSPKPRKKRPAPKNTAPGKKSGLTAQQARFVELLVVENKTATDAAIGAGYSAKTAPQIGYNLIHKNSLVIEAIKNRRESLSMRSLATRERWEEEVCRLAFFDPRKIFDASGFVRPVNEWDSDTAAAVENIQNREIFDGSGDQRSIVGIQKAIQLASKNKALEMLAKANGWILDRKEITGKDGAPLVPSGPVMDLSRLSIEELEQLEAIQRKAMRPMESED